MTKLESKRRSLGISIRDMADNLQMHFNSYWKKEKKNSFTIEEANKICKILNCNYEDIFM